MGVMEIAVVGPGALGCAVAARLWLAGRKVCLVDYRPQRAAALRHRGIIFREPQGPAQTLAVPVVLPSALQPVEVVILTVKSHQTRDAAAFLPRFLAPQGVVLTLQNGLGNVETLARVLGPERLLAGVSILGITRVGEGEVVLAGLGPTWIGAPPGSQVSGDKIRRLAETFRQAGLPCEVREDIEAALWEKLLVNVGINPLTALLRVRNGGLLELRPAWDLAVTAAAEARRVAAAAGLSLTVDPETRLREVCTATSANRSSMLQDILAGRRTEIDALNGEVVRRGAALGIPTPVNACLTALIKALEALAASDAGNDGKGGGPCS
jgi:2-dehydropantoate 2-reductase